MSSFFNRLANPTRFVRLATAVLPWTALLALACLGSGLYFALFDSPADYQQGESVRIMYVHVPSAWLAMAGYSTVAISSACALIWKHPLADLIAKSASPVGACFALLCLLTGSLWGKPMWGTWWAWDARLTSVLILFFLYIGHYALLHAFDDAQRGAKAAAVLALAGFINVPIIKFSVDWWNTLHQPASVSKMGMPSVDPRMLLPLLLMAFGYTFFFVTVLLVRVKGEILAAKIKALRLGQLQAAQ